MPPGMVGHYTIEHELGHGQNASVYLARDVRLDRRVALKVLNRTGDHAWAEMLQEARLASGLDHRYICTIYDVGEAETEGENVPYIAMEYVDGPSLAETLEDGPLQPIMTLRFATQLCEALTYAHERGVIHGDIKASNVLISPDGEAKCVDFGSAARSARGGAASAQGDVWALGILLYQMATGEDPPPQTVAGPSGSLKVPRSVPRGLAAIIEGCVDNDLTRRYHSAREVLHDLRAECDHPDSVPPGRKHPIRRQPLLLLALEIVVLLALLIIGVETGRLLQPSESPPPSHTQPHPPPALATASGRSRTPEAGRPDVKVWANDRTMKYHCPGSPWYGRTSTGQFLTQKEAQKAGYAPAYGVVCP